MFRVSRRVIFLDSTPETNEGFCLGLLRFGSITNSSVKGCNMPRV